MFSPEAWKLSQAFDYCQLLYRELRVLNDRMEEHFDWQTRARSTSVRREIESTNRVIRELTDQVRSKAEATSDRLKAEMRVLK